MSKFSNFKIHRRIIRSHCQLKIIAKYSNCRNLKNSTHKSRFLKFLKKRQGKR